MLRATVGDIIIRAWDRPDIDVEIVRRAPSLEALAEISADIESDNRGLRIAAVHRDAQRDARLQAAVTVRAPAGQRFESVELFEGRITLVDLRGAVRAHVEHGSIDATSLAGSIRLETGIGNLRLERTEVSDAGLIRLRTFNGNVALGLAASPAHARILALSLGGTIQSDLPLNLKTGYGPRFGEATLGRGTPVVSIDVVSGDIRIVVGKV